MIIVLDHDGTLTDLEVEAQHYFDNFARELARLLGIEITKIARLLSEQMALVAAHPNEYGWKDNGVIMCPATTDPYIHVGVAAQLVLQILSASGDINTLADKWDALLDGIFRHCYLKSKTVYKPQARDFVETLRANVIVAVVSNSNPDAVEEKIKTLLGETHNVIVIGNARKYRHTPQWEKVPEQVMYPGFPRPIHMRRKYYYDILDLLRIRDIHGVCGDIWELDLGLAEFLGLRTALALSNRTPSWERNHYVNHPNGFASDSLEELAKYLLE